MQLFLHIGSIPFSSSEDEERLSRMECGEVKLAGICLIGNVSQHQPAINLWLSLDISWKVLLGMWERQLHLHFNQKISFTPELRTKKIELKIIFLMVKSELVWRIFYSTNNIISLAWSNYICVGKSNYTNWESIVLSSLLSSSSGDSGHCLWDEISRKSEELLSQITLVTWPWPGISADA